MHINFTFLCFVLAFPTLAVLIHDIWLAFFADAQTIQAIHDQISDLGEFEPREFSLSSFEILWQIYSPDSLEYFRQNSNPDLWKNFIEPIIQRAAIWVTFVPAFFAYLFLGTAWMMGFWPFNYSVGPRTTKNLVGSRDNKYDRN